MTPNQPERQSAYETFVLFVLGKGGTVVFVVVLFALIAVIMISKSGVVWGIDLPRVLFFWFFGFVALQVLGGVLGWGLIAERKRLQGKLKPIPLRGKRIELYDIETGKPLAQITESELQYLIDSFAEMGMEDNDFYILREQIDRYEEKGADPKLVATLREMMGEKNSMEIGWTRV